MIRSAILVSLVTVLAGCERSARTVEIQPSNQGVKPETTNGGDTLTKTGRLAIEMTGFAASASSGEVRILINDDLETQVVNISGGSGTALVSGVLPGNSVIKVRVTAAGATYSGSTSATLVSGELVRARIQLVSGGVDTGVPNNSGTNNSGTNNGGLPNNGGTNNGGLPNNGGTNNGGLPNNGGTNNGGLPNNGGTNNSGNSDLDISIDIGGNSGGGGGGGTSNQQNIWDGKSFKGNSMFNIEPVK
jgi:hypothetical protein